MPGRVREDGVFLNVPFDSDYEPLFLALIAGVIGIGCQPRCVLELPDGGAGRLTRLVEIIQSNRYSIHDLSRVTLSKGVPRFNMPFELGLACAVARLRPGRHDYFVFEERQYRLLKSTSDLNGIDPQIHGGSGVGVLRAILNCFATEGHQPTLAELEDLYRHVREAAKELKRENRVDSVFSRNVFTELLEVTLDIAEAQGLVT